jgi:hypothetical protein
LGCKAQHRFDERADEGLVEDGVEVMSFDELAMLRGATVILRPANVLLVCVHCVVETRTPLREMLGDEEGRVIVCVFVACK